jgi:hypothetical protein
MKIHDKIAEAMKQHVGRTLSSKKVIDLVMKKFPGTNPTSIVPGDCSGPNPKSGRSYCKCSGTTRQIFKRQDEAYKVLAVTGTVNGQASRSSASTADRIGKLPNDHEIVIDDAFISEWHPKYAEEDEDEYERLVATVAQEIDSKGTIQKKTFLAIWKWKGAMRVIGLVKIEEYDTLYAPAFRRVISVDPKHKLGELLGVGKKLPGVGAPTGSTIIHFIHPQIMPIIDVRTIGVLLEAGLIPSQQADLAHYEEFRISIEGIRCKCPSWTLRQIDRALFAYHKQVLGNRIPKRHC